MFNRLKEIFEKVRFLSKSIDKYQKDTVIQSLPSLAYVNRAKKLIEQNNYAAAEAVLTEALSLPQEDSLVFKYLGMVYERTGRPFEAVQSYQKSADLNPHDKNIWQRLGFMLISVEKYEKAEKSFDNANKIQAGNSDTFTGWGMALMKLKEYAKAREKFMQASKLNKYNFSAVFLCAVMEIKLKMYDKAETKLAFLANVSPNESNTFEYARLKALKDDIDNAIHYAQKSLEYNPKMLPAYILLGQLYAQKLDEEKSLNYFETASQQNLKNPNLYLEWGKVLVKFEKFEQAKEKLLQAKELAPENTEITANLGLCLVELKEYSQAEPLLQYVTEKEPENKTVKQALGIIAYINNNIDKAISILKYDDEDAVNCFYIAKCYEKKENDTKVKEYYESALRINNRYITAYINYINYLINRNEFAEAQRKLRKAIKFDENNINLLNLMFYVSYILVKDNVSDYNLKEALSYAQKIENMGEELLKYPGQKQELVNLLHEREQN